MQEETELKIQHTLDLKNLVPSPKSFMGKFYHVIVQEIYPDFLAI
jgi:hypothetical protein